MGNAPAPHRDPLPLAQGLIRCPSVTPADAGALGVLEAALKDLGFACERMPFAQDGTVTIDNLYARLGHGGPNFCFAGHTDVVPVGQASGWTVDPFGAEIIGGHLYGRGAADMKGAIAAFVAAVARFTARAGSKGSISLLITGDEEGPSINGTAKMLKALAARGERLDACLVGEPTSTKTLGDTAKIGRRGSLNGRVVVHGIQGHSAYPHLADNPIPRLARMIHVLADEPFDAGTEHFEPTSLAFTTVDVGNPATNVIPAQASAAFNMRFNDLHTPATLTGQLKARLDSVGGEYALAIDVAGEAFLTRPGRLSSVLTRAVQQTLGITPALTTGGGTSDARFIKSHCPVIELGLVGTSMHKADERVPVADLDRLARVYESVLDNYFAA
ncbi:MAG: succinyl-diaminopimelate desuccinylase [Alphaproteobacteria bacterium]